MCSCSTGVFKPQLIHSWLFVDWWLGSTCAPYPPPLCPPRCPSLLIGTRRAALGLWTLGISSDLRHICSQHGAFVESVSPWGWGVGREVSIHSIMELQADRNLGHWHYRHSAIGRIPGDCPKQADARNTSAELLAVGSLAFVASDMLQY